jgi:hypothetical protein
MLAVLYVVACQAFVWDPVATARRSVVRGWYCVRLRLNGNMCEKTFVDTPQTTYIRCLHSRWLTAGVVVSNPSKSAAVGIVLLFNKNVPN